VITVNQPFYSLEPLTTYLGALEQVTEHPTEASIAELDVADKALTDRAVLFPKQQYVHQEGYRTFGFKPCTISDGVEALARLALHEPGSSGYSEEYGRVFPSGASPNSDTATEENRRSQARGALITLGGKLAVSGAFIEHEIEPAYTAISESLGAIGKSDEDFKKFGLHRISHHLFKECVYMRQSGTYQNPIGNKEARKNIDIAWGVVGRPYGVFTKLIAAVS